MISGLHPLHFLLFGAPGHLWSHKTCQVISFYPSTSLSSSHRNVIAAGFSRKLWFEAQVLGLRVLLCSFCSFSSSLYFLKMHTPPLSPTLVRETQLFLHDSPLTGIEYADDTLFLSRTAQSLNRFLHNPSYSSWISVTFRLSTTIVVSILFSIIPI